MIKTFKKHASLREMSNINENSNMTHSHGLNSHNALSPYRPIALTPCKRYAFTMAEILLSLTIIGVVAAITLPSLMANINERTWNTQRKALYARMSQAIAMMPQLGGYGQYEGTNTDGVVTTTVDTAAETFLTEGLSKVLKINNICDSEHLADCGVAASFTTLAGSNKTWPTKLSELNAMFTDNYDDNGSAEGGNIFHNTQNHIDTKAAAFETQNGETITIYYNPYCDNKKEETGYILVQPKMCANFIYDLNGNKGPNSVGKDIGFITALYNFEPNVVAPMPLSSNARENTTIAQNEASSACTTQDPESRLPNIDELSAMFYNRELIDIKMHHHWSSSAISPEEAWTQNFTVGWRNLAPRTNTTYVRCVKR